MARAFVGEGDNLVLNDLVCRICNTKRFSACEREWTAFPGLAMARIHFGPAGRTRKGTRYRVHPGEQLYLIADDDPLAYEVEILEGVTARLRAQVIGLETGLMACAADEADGVRLNAAIDLFNVQREITAYKHPDENRAKRFLIATVNKRISEQRVRIVHYEWRPKPTNVWLDRFPPNPARTPLYARMSVDQDDRLRIRAENIETAVALFDRLLNEIPSVGEGGTFEPGAYTVAISSSSNLSMVYRAIAKTAFNLAIYTLGADAMRDLGFDACRTFCWRGTGDNPNHPFVGIITDNAVKDLPLEFRVGSARHTLMLTSDGRALVCFIQLYGVSAWKVHIGFFFSAVKPFRVCYQVDYAGQGFLTP